MGARTRNKERWPMDWDNMTLWSTGPDTRRRMLKHCGLGEDVDTLTTALELTMLSEGYEDGKDVLGADIGGKVCWCAVYGTLWRLLAIAPAAECGEGRKVSRELFFAAKWPASWVTRQAVKLRNGEEWVKPVNPPATVGSRMAGRIQSGRKASGRGICMLAICIEAENDKPTWVLTDDKSVPVAADSLGVVEWWVLNKNFDGFDVLWARNQTTMANSRFLFMRLGLEQKRFEKRGRVPGEAQQAQEYIAQLTAELMSETDPDKRRTSEEELTEWRKILKLTARKEK